MLDPIALFAELGTGISAMCGGPFFTGSVVDQAGVERDVGGDVIPGSGGPVIRSCDVQIEEADFAMRSSKGYVEGQMKCIILAGTLDGALGTDAVVAIDSGPYAGTTWQVSRINRDSLGTHWLGTAVEA